MFDPENFIEDCRQAVTEDDDHKAIRDIVAHVVSEPSRVISALGDPRKAGIGTIYHAPNLTILNVTWAPLMTLIPHNHNMWAVIGIYTGREDNIYWRRTEAGIEAAGAKALSVKEVLSLGRNIIHSVTNPISRITGAIHVYGGDFFADGRSEWDPEKLQERPYDIEGTRSIFADANRRFAS